MVPNYLRLYERLENALKGFKDLQRVKNEYSQHIRINKVLDRMYRSILRNQKNLELKKGVNIGITKKMPEFVKNKNDFLTSAHDNGIIKVLQKKEELSGSEKETMVKCDNRFKKLCMLLNQIKILNVSKKNQEQAFLKEKISNCESSSNSDVDRSTFTNVGSENKVYKSLIKSYSREKDILTDKLSKGSLIYSEKSLFNEKIKGNSNACDDNTLRIKNVSKNDSINSESDSNLKIMNNAANQQEKNFENKKTPVGLQLEINTGLSKNETKDNNLQSNNAKKSSKIKRGNFSTSNRIKKHDISRLSMENIKDDKQNSENTIINTQNTDKQSIGKKKIEKTIDDKQNNENTIINKQTIGKKKIENTIDDKQNNENTIINKQSIDKKIIDGVFIYKKLCFSILKTLKILIDNNEFLLKKLKGIEKFTHDSTKNIYFKAKPKLLIDMKSPVFINENLREDISKKLISNSYHQESEKIDKKKLILLNKEKIYNDFSDETSLNNFEFCYKKNSEGVGIKKEGSYNLSDVINNLSESKQNIKYEVEDQNKIDNEYCDKVLYELTNIEKKSSINHTSKNEDFDNKDSFKNGNDLSENKKIDKTHLGRNKEDLYKNIDKNNFYKNIDKTDLGKNKKDLYQNIKKTYFGEKENGNKVNLFKNIRFKDINDDIVYSNSKEKTLSNDAIRFRFEEKIPKTKIEEKINICTKTKIDEKTRIDEKTNSDEKIKMDEKTNSGPKTKLDKKINTDIKIYPKTTQYNDSSENYKDNTQDMKKSDIKNDSYIKNKDYRNINTSNQFELTEILNKVEHSNSNIYSDSKSKNDDQGSTTPQNLNVNDNNSFKFSKAIHNNMIERNVSKTGDFEQLPINDEKSRAIKSTETDKLHDKNLSEELNLTNVLKCSKNKSYQEQKNKKPSFDKNEVGFATEYDNYSLNALLYNLTNEVADFNETSKHNSSLSNELINTEDKSDINPKLQPFFNKKLLHLKNLRNDPSFSQDSKYFRCKNKLTSKAIENINKNDSHQTLKLQGPKKNHRKPDLKKKSFVDLCNIVADDKIIKMFRSLNQNFTSEKSDLKNHEQDGIDKKSYQFSITKENLQNKSSKKSDTMEKKFVADQIPLSNISCKKKRQKNMIRKSPLYNPTQINENNIQDQKYDVNFSQGVLSLERNNCKNYSLDSILKLDISSLENDDNHEKSSVLTENYSLNSVLNNKSLFQSDKKTTSYSLSDFHDHYANNQFEDASCSEFLNQAPNNVIETVHTIKSKNVLFQNQPDLVDNKSSEILSNIKSKEDVNSKSWYKSNDYSLEEMMDRFKDDKSCDTKISYLHENSTYQDIKSNKCVSCLNLKNSENSSYNNETSMNTNQHKKLVDSKTKKQEESFNNHVYNNTDKKFSHQNYSLHDILRKADFIESDKCEEKEETQQDLMKRYSCNKLLRNNASFLKNNIDLSKKDVDLPKNTVCFSKANENLSKNKENSLINTKHLSKNTDYLSKNNYNSSQIIFKNIPKHILYRNYDQRKKIKESNIHKANVNKKENDFSNHEIIDKTKNYLYSKKFKNLDLIFNEYIDFLYAEYKQKKLKNKSLKKTLFLKDKIKFLVHKESVDIHPSNLSCQRINKTSLESVAKKLKNMDQKRYTNKNNIEKDECISNNVQIINLGDHENNTSDKSNETYIRKHNSCETHIHNETVSTEKKRNSYAKTRKMGKNSPNKGKSKKHINKTKKHIKEVLNLDNTRLDLNVSSRKGPERFYDILNTKSYSQNQSEKSSQIFNLSTNTQSDKGFKKIDISTDKNVEYGQNSSINEKSLNTQNLNTQHLISKDLYSRDLSSKNFQDNDMHHSKNNVDTARKNIMHLDSARSVKTEEIAHFKRLFLKFLEKNKKKLDENTLMKNISAEICEFKKLKQFLQMSEPVKYDEENKQLINHEEIGFQEEKTDNQHDFRCSNHHKISQDSKLGYYADVYQSEEELSERSCFRKILKEQNAFSTNCQDKLENPIEKVIKTTCQKNLHLLKDNSDSTEDTSNFTIVNCDSAYAELSEKNIQDPSEEMKFMSMNTTHLCKSQENTSNANLNNITNSNLNNASNRFKKNQDTYNGMELEKSSDICESNIIQSQSRNVNCGNKNSSIRNVSSNLNSKKSTSPYINKSTFVTHNQDNSNINQSNLISSRNSYLYDQKDQQLTQNLKNISQIDNSNAITSLKNYSRNQSSSCKNECSVKSTPFLFNASQLCTPNIVYDENNLELANNTDENNNENNLHEKIDKLEDKIEQKDINLDTKYITTDIIKKKIHNSIRKLYLSRLKITEKLINELNLEMQLHKNENNSKSQSFEVLLAKYKIKSSLYSILKILRRNEMGSGKITHKKKIEKSLNKIFISHVKTKLKVTESILKELEGVLVQGNLQDDMRFMEKLEKLLKEIDKFETPRFFKICVQLEIAKKYVKDIISLKKKSLLRKYYDLN